MTALSDYLETALLTWSMTNGAVTRPTAWYVALYSVAPTDAGGGTELSGVAGLTGYARQAATFSIGTGGNSNVASNTGIINFVSTSDWPNIVAVGIFDAATGGNLLWYGNLTTPRDPASGDTIQFAAGALTCTLN